MLKKKQPILLFLNIALIAFLIGVIFSYSLMKQSNNKIEYINKNDYFEQIIFGDIEQKDINNRDYKYEMSKLDELLPLVSKELNLSVEDFKKQEIKGGEYYYEAVYEKYIFYFELDKVQNDPTYLKYSLHRRLQGSEVREKIITVIFTLSKQI